MKNIFPSSNLINVPFQLLDDYYRKARTAHSLVPDNRVTTYLMLGAGNCNFQETSSLFHFPFFNNGKKVKRKRQRQQFLRFERRRDRHVTATYMNVASCRVYRLFRSMFNVHRFIQFFLRFILDKNYLWCNWNFAISASNLQLHFQLMRNEMYSFRCVVCLNAELFAFCLICFITFLLLLLYIYSWSFAHFLI